MAACGRLGICLCQVLVATFFVPCQTHRSSHTRVEVGVVEKSSADTPGIAVASAVLQWALISKNAVQAGSVVYDHVVKHLNFEDTSRQAIADLDSFLSKIVIKGGLTPREIVGSQYLELVALRDRFDAMKSFCQPSQGLLHILVAAIWGDIEPGLAANISIEIDDVQGKLSEIADSMFCSHFEELLDKELVQLGALLSHWEVTSSQQWFPKRSYPNRILAGKSHKTLMEVYGLSKQQANRFKYLEIRNNAANAMGGNPWINVHSSFEDTLLSNTTVGNASKIALEAGIREVRVLFEEMSRLSTQCHARAHILWCKYAGGRKAKGGCHKAEQDGTSDTFLTYPFCERCPACCTVRNQKWPWLVYIEKHLEEYKELISHFYDASAVLLPSPSSFLWIAARLATSGKRKHRELCGAALKLLQGQSVSQAEVPSLELVDNGKTSRPQGDKDTCLQLPQLDEIVTTD